MIKDKLDKYGMKLLFVTDYSQISFDNIISLGGIFAIICFGGDEDISPVLYGKCNLFSKKINPERDDFEIKLFNFAYCNDIPFLGICRGMQLINIALGGTLNQDIGYKKTIHYADWNSYCTSRKHVLHKVIIQPNTFLASAFSDNIIDVNSYHHQSVENLGKELTISALSEDNIIEGVEHISKPIIGLQWHIELMNDYQSELFLDKYIELIKNRSDFY